MFGSGEEIPNSSSLFASKLVSLYTSTLGDWSYLLISICAFSVMFSTTVSVIDGYSRSMSLTLKNLSIGTTYAIWSGLGILLICLVGYFRYGQNLDFPAIIGILFIGIGILIIRFFSVSINL